MLGHNKPYDLYHEVNPRGLNVWDLRSSGDTVASFYNLELANRIARLLNGEMELIINVEGGCLNGVQNPLPDMKVYWVHWSDMPDSDFDTIIGVWRIRMTIGDSNSWWSAKRGWVAKVNATVFSQEEMEDYGDLPPHSEWVPDADLAAHVCQVDTELSFKSDSDSMKILNRYKIDKAVADLQEKEAEHGAV